MSSLEAAFDELSRSVHRLLRPPPSTDEDRILMNACIVGSSELVYVEHPNPLRFYTDDFGRRMVEVLPARTLVGYRLQGEPDEALHARLCQRGAFPRCPDRGRKGHGVI